MNKVFKNSIVGYLITYIIVSIILIGSYVLAGKYSPKGFWIITLILVFLFMVYYLRFKRQIIEIDNKNFLYQSKSFKSNIKIEESLAKIKFSLRKEVVSKGASVFVLRIFIENEEVIKIQPSDGWSQGKLIDIGIWLDKYAINVSPPGENIIEQINKKV